MIPLIKSNELHQHPLKHYQLNNYPKNISYLIHICIISLTIIYSSLFASGITKMF